MHNRYIPSLNPNELERKILEASDAIRKNAERGKAIRLRRERLLAEQRKVIYVAPVESDDEEGDEEE